MENKEAPPFKKPAAQILWETYYAYGTRDAFRKVTSNKDRSKYYLWEVVAGKWEQTKTAASPLKLR